MDFIITEAMEFCGGNPGALTFFLEALKEAEGNAKSSAALKVVSAFNRMKENNITGSKLYMLWNDCCDRDIDRAIYIMLHDTIESINKHINFGNGRGIPYTESEPEPYKRESEGEWWIFTFMSDGSDKEGKCVKVKGTFGEARKKMCDKYGIHWAFQRSEKEWEESWNDIDRAYPLEEIIDTID